jgi:hypothetical protein
MNKEIPCYKFDRAVRYKPDEIASWMELRKQQVEEKDDKALVNDSGLELFESGASDE